MELYADMINSLYRERINKLLDSFDWNKIEEIFRIFDLQFVDPPEYSKYIPTADKIKSHVNLLLERLIAMS